MLKNKLFLTRLLIVLAMVLILSLATVAGALGPFVETDAQAIRTFEGEQIGDWFGWAAENLGDITGDGVNDVIISAPVNSQAGPRAGKAYIFSGTDEFPVFAVSGQAHEGFGWGVSTAGDVNDDGTNDFIVGGPGFQDAPEPFKGRVAVYSGAGNHDMLWQFQAGIRTGVGYDVNTAGDVNGDGNDDVIVGAPFTSDAAFLAGRVYVFSGLNGDEIWHMDGKGEQNFLGEGVGPVGDVNHDGTPDVVASAYGAGKAGGGEAYVYSGVDGEVLLTLQPDKPGTGIRFGQFFASTAGDVNNDGTPDIFIGDYPNKFKGGVGTGRAYVFSGTDGSILYTFDAENRGDGLGVGRGIGDINADGYDDLIIAAYTNSDGAPAGGKAYLHSGMDGSVLRTITGRIANDNLGVDALSVGDIDGDGLTDYLLTSVGNSFAGIDVGRAYIVNGTP